MATITVSDDLGATINVSPAPGSAISQYLENPTNLKLLKGTLQIAKNLPLKDAQIRSASAGLEFAEPLDIGLPNIQLNVNAGASGDIAIFAAPGAALFDGDVFQDNIAVAAGRAYLAIGWACKALAGPSAGTTAAVGFQAGSEVKCTNYHGSPDSTLFLTALADALSAFIIPLQASDLGALPVGSICTSEGQGTLLFSLSANATTESVLFATSAIGDLLGSPQTAPVNINASATIGVQASCRLSCEYQVRIQKIDSSTVHFGIYKKRQTEASTGMAAAAGITTQIGTTDLAQMILQLLSGDPTLDDAALRAAGATDDEIAGFNKAVHQVIQHNLQASLNAEIEDKNSNAFAFVYEINLPQLDASGMAAISEALRGNLLPLTTTENQLCGIHALRHISDQLQGSTVAVGINLFGIYNYLSLRQLLLNSVTCTDIESGAVSIVDKASADRIQISIDNAEKNAQKIRRLINESTIITAAYHASFGKTDSPKQEVQSLFFRSEQDAGFQAMNGLLNVACALTLINSQQMQELLGADASRRFGAASLMIKAAYESDLVTKLFCASDASGTLAARPVSYFDTIGRLALAALLKGDATGAADLRRLPLTDDAVWAQLRSNGNVNAFSSIPALSGRTTSTVQRVGHDYILITWWSNAMSALSETLADLRNYVRNNQPGLTDPQFLEKRRKLGQYMKNVVKETDDSFGDPWGFIAMYLASDRQANLSFSIKNPFVNLNLSPQRVLTLEPAYARCHPV